MNAEQLKQLKPDDEIFIRARYITTLDGGDVLFSHSITYDSSMTINMEDYTHHKNIILPSELQPAPKYDPCRLFKKGDKATPRIVNGRKPVCGIDGVAAKINSVELIVESNEGERENGTVDIKFPCGTIGQIDPVYLELVTPVEELEPYFVMELKGAYGVYNTRFQPETEACHFFTDMHPHAKEAAEAECARMNAEHRKEQA